MILVAPSIASIMMRSSFRDLCNHMISTLWELYMTRLHGAGSEAAWLGQAV